MFSLLNKNKNFMKSDIKWKLKKISKIIDLTLYPKKNYRAELKFLYSLLEFNFIFTNDHSQNKNF